MTLTQINKAGLDELALDHVFTIGASGTDHYTFQGEGLNGTVNDPTLYLTRGKTYRFENGSGGHPIRIQSTSGASGTAYNTGVTNNAGSGTVIVEVQHDAPDVLYYQCTSHAAMNGILYITGALADGGVTTAKIADDAVNNDKLANSVVASIAANTAKTSNATHTGDVTGSTSLTIANNAVTTTKIADDAVTGDKIDANAVSTSHITDNSITSAKIANEAVTLAKLPHGTSSNDGKFLRANNGADPTFETVTGTTINNNADNKLITGSGTANTLEGESTTFDGTNLKFSATNTQIELQTSNNSDNGFLNFSGGGACSQGRGAQVVLFGNDYTDYQGRLQLLAGQSGHANGTIDFYTSGSRKVIIDSSGNVGIGTASPAKALDVSGEIRASSGILFGSDTASNYALDDYEEGSWTATCVSGGSSLTNDSTNNRYVKIGSMVYITGEVYALVNPSNNTFEVGGLPYQIAQSREGTGSIMTHHVTYGSGRTMATIYVYASQSKFRIYTSGNATAWRALTGSDFSVSGDIIFSFAYHTV